MTKVIVSSPGKLMLLGEHAVVYDHPCLVTAVGQRLFLEIEQIVEPRLEIEALEVGIKNYIKPMNKLGIGDVPKGANFIEYSVCNFMLKHPFDGGIRIRTKSEFSSLFGFGSSSATAVCTVKALSELMKKNLLNKELFDIAYKSVIDIQRVGSGFDIASAIYGGTIYFRTGGVKIEPITFTKIPLVIGYSGIKADTTAIVSRVAKKSENYSKIINSIYNDIEILVNRARKALETEDWNTIGELMNFNQGFLEGLGVSSKKLATMIYAAREAGALGAKLSGAGGGDCMIALVEPENRKKISDAICAVGGQVIDIPTGVEGVRLEDTIL